MADLKIGHYIPCVRTGTRVLLQWIGRGPPVSDPCERLDHLNRRGHDSAFRA